MGNKLRKSQQGRLIGALLRVPYFNVEDHVYQALLESGFNDLTHAHLIVFQVIEAKGGSRLTKMAEDARMTKPSMGYLIDVLEEAGYLKRVADPDDSRARLVQLTEHGHAVLDTALTVVRQLEVEWAELLGEEKFVTMRESLRDLVTILEDD